MCFHLDEQRHGTVLVEVACAPRDVTDWGALGAAIGRQVNDYWSVPVLDAAPDGVTPNQLKHLGAALASYGSLAMFHMVGLTPEAPRDATAFHARAPERKIVVDEMALRAVYESFQSSRDRADLVVLSGPQLSLFEIRTAAELIEGRFVRDGTSFIVTTNAQNLHMAAELGYLDILRKAGVLVLGGTCFYLMNVPALRDRFNWHSLVTNSAKVANIVGGYELEPVLRSTEACVEAAITGEIPSV